MGELWLDYNLRHLLCCEKQNSVYERLSWKIYLFDMAFWLSYDSKSSALQGNWDLTIWLPMSLTILFPLTGNFHFPSTLLISSWLMWVHALHFSSAILLWIWNVISWLWKIIAIWGFNFLLQLSLAQ